MDLSKYSKEEIYGKLVEALKEGFNHLKNANRLIKENNDLKNQLSLQNVIKCDCCKKIIYDEKDNVLCKDCEDYC